MSARTKLRLPREHGAWAMLYVPFAVGVLVAGQFTIAILLLLLAITLVFVARESLVAWWRTRSRRQQDDRPLRLAIVYLVFAGVFTMPLFVVWHLNWLAPACVAAALLLGVNAQQAARHSDRTVVGETIAIAGLTLTAPAAHYVATGTLESTAFWLWALSSAYFASSVFYVKLRVNTISRRREDERRRAWRRCAGYHSFLLVALLVLAFGGSLSLFALAAFCPVLVRSFWYLAKPARQINLRSVGWLEIIYSVVFLVFTTLTFR